MRVGLLSTFEKNLIAGKAVLVVFKPVMIDVHRICRKGPVGEEPAAMTIEFLRARLQAERSASKTVKLKLEGLSKKVCNS